MLHEKVLNLKQNVNQITINPILNGIELEECVELDRLYPTNPFIKEKVDTCIKIIDELRIDFQPEYRTLYEEYNEAIVYLNLINRYSVNRIPESSTKTPDFQIVQATGEFTFDIYAEVKSLSFLDGNLNYKAAEQSGTNSKITSEDRAKQFGIGFGEAIISPFLKNNKLPTTSDLIGIYIDKINQNIKKGQFEMGETVLMVDIKQLSLGSHWYESPIAIYHEKATLSMASGVLWNVAFGKLDDSIYKPIEFEGKSNIDMRLRRNGILEDHPYIKGLVFCAYKNFSEKKYLGFYRQKEQDEPVPTFIQHFTEFYNDEQNTWAFKILQKKIPL